MQASDLIGRIAVVMKTCGEEVLMSHLGVVLYEYLGEEYPEVLGSILGALKVSWGWLGVGEGGAGGGRGSGADDDTRLVILFLLFWAVVWH